MYLFNTRVAHHAGPGHVVAVNARARIGVLEDIVRRMARGTDRGHRESFFEQTLTMNTL